VEFGISECSAAAASAVDGYACMQPACVSAATARFCTYTKHGCSSLKCTYEAVWFLWFPLVLIRDWQLGISCLATNADGTCYTSPAHLTFSTVL
jgi:hypothetical protein